jgi:hypothetical protein
MVCYPINFGTQKDDWTYPFVIGEKSWLVHVPPCFIYWVDYVTPYFSPKGLLSTRDLLPLLLRLISLGHSSSDCSPSTSLGASHHSA